jgi:hypothetical protein
MKEHSLVGLSNARNLQWAMNLTLHSDNMSHTRERTGIRYLPLLRSNKCNILSTAGFQVLPDVTMEIFVSDK